MASRLSERELLQLETRFWQAMQDKDADAAVSLATDPCIVTGPQGVGRIDRETLGAMLKSPSYSIRHFELKDVQVDWQGDDLVTVAYTVHEELEVEGEQVTIDAADSSTWVRRDGHFLCAVHTETLIGDPFGRDKRPSDAAQAETIPAGGKARAHFVLTRLFEAPPAVLFEAWSKPEHLGHWWPPPTFTLPTCEMDFRRGGTFRQCMRSPEGRDYWSHGTYDEVAAPRRLVFTTLLDDEPGHQVHTEVTFAEQDGRTRLTVRESFDDTPMTRYALAGLSACFDLLEAYLVAKGDELREATGGPGPERLRDQRQTSVSSQAAASRPELELILDPAKPTIVTRRVVEAPRSLVFEAFTRPEYLSRWMGPRTAPMILCQMDLRVGGNYRFVHRALDGQRFGFHGTYREILPPERLVRSFVFEWMPEHEALETLLLEERGGKTTITTITVHKTLEGRDAHFAGGRMAEGMEEGYARLDELLASMSAGASPDAGM